MLRYLWILAILFFITFIILVTIFTFKAKNIAKEDDEKELNHL